jgi:hypothetical protein
LLTVSAILAGLIAMAVAETQFQSVPDHAAAQIDKRYPGWSYRPVHLPNPCDLPKHKGPTFRAITICNLNGDSTPDFIVAIVTRKDSVIAEYFLAVISSGSDFSLLPLDSAVAHEGLGERSIVCCPAGDTVACFTDDSLVTQYGHNVLDENHWVFPTDVIEIMPECEAHWKEVEIDAYVLIGQSILKFSGAD